MVENAFCIYNRPKVGLEANFLVMEDRGMENAQTLLDEAVRQHESGKLDAAAPLYQRVLRLDPGHAGALYHLGKLELARSNSAAGAELLRQAAAKSPDAADVHQSLGVAYKQLGKWGNAAQSFERALAINPDHAPSFFELGELSQSLGRAEAAIGFYQRVINLDSANTEAFRRLGELLYARGNWIGAENCFARVIDTGLLNHDLATLTELMSKLGIALTRQEKLDQAALVYKRILALAPPMAEMYSNLAYVYERQGRLDEALAAGLRAVELKPAYAEGHNNLGVAYRALHRLEEARRCFAEAIALEPDFALAQFNLGSLDLLQGHLAAGWRGYEWRERTKVQPARQLAAPRWNGQPIPGQTLLVHAEQGYGDAIQFVRFLNKAKQRSGAQIILEGPAALLPLFRGIAGADEVLRAGTALPHIDAEIPLSSLPGALGIGLSDLTPAIPYLEAPESCRRNWHERLAMLVQTRRTLHASDLLKVGFCWSGNPVQHQNIVRSCPLAAFAGLAPIPGIAWYSLQKEADQALLYSAWPDDARVEALGPMLNDFADTAAAICELDLVISVDTSVAHLTGALGHSGWTLLSHTPDWRWQLDRADSAWYPTLRLFRQPRWGDWKAVFESVGTALRKFSTERRSGRGAD